MPCLWSCYGFNRKCRLVSVWEGGIYSLGLRQFSLIVRMVDCNSLWFFFRLKMKILVFFFFYSAGLVNRWFKCSNAPRKLCAPILHCSLQWSFIGEDCTISATLEVKHAMWFLFFSFISQSLDRWGTQWALQSFPRLFALVARRRGEIEICLSTFHCQASSCSLVFLVVLRLLLSHEVLV